MDVSEPFSIGRTAADVFALLLAIVCAYVSLDCARRVGPLSDRMKPGWLLGASVTLASGVLGLHVVGLLSQLPGYGLYYNVQMLLLAWLAGVGLAALAWVLLAISPPNPLQVLGSALLLTAATLLPHALGISALSLQPGALWSSHHVLSALVVNLCASVLVVVLQILGQRSISNGWLAQTLATVLLAGTLWWGQQALTLAAGLPYQTASASVDALAHHTLLPLAVLGTSLVLIMTWITAYTETRLKRSLAQANDALVQQAQTDSLTGLPNRASFEEHLARTALQMDQSHSALALLLVDLDGFRPINESFGHRFGDELLQAVATRLRSFCRQNMTLARLGGDEFLILLEPGLTRETVAAQARALLDHLGSPIEVGDRAVPVAASIGIALYPTDAAQSMLISHADVAAHAAKNLGGDTYCFFEPQLLSQAREQVELLHDLRSALTDNQFEIYYQPKIHVPSGEVTGAEALLRWNHPVRGLVSPAVFIPVAERYALINTIGDWVIDEVCHQISIWRTGGLRMRVAINLSLQQLRQPDLYQRLAAAMQRHGVNPQQITCEITESMAMDDAASTREFFQRLAEIGVHISIDDFGTGYSSLSHLRQLPTEELKIDRSFVNDLESSADARAVVDAVVKLGQALRLKVVAEGVETEAQHRILRELGCHELQGYLFARPMTAKNLFLWAKFDSGPNTIPFRSSLFGDSQIQP
ncbi:MAG TPA: EAL domain-containing protein [Macromonas sp.]|nr:EAL domain-containing protein [Macromonas sp.]